MSDIRTRSVFTLKKDEAALGFLTTSRDVRNAISARLFSRPPGHLLDAVVTLQVDYKHKLDAATLALVEQQIEREMRLLNVGYSKTYKEAAMDFEVRKHNLMNDLTAELALLRKTETELDADVEELLAEIQLRQTIIISQEAILTREKQALLQQKIEAERLSFDKELEYVNAQLAYATRKLDLIPLIRQVIDAQKNVITAERGPMYDALSALLTAKSQLATAKQGLIIPMIEKAEAVLAYATGQEAVIPYILAKASMSRNVAAATYSYTTQFQMPAAMAKLSYVKSQSNALAYMTEVANQRSLLASEEALVAAKAVEKAEADLDLAQAELRVAEAQIDRAHRLASELLPAQRELVAAILQDVEYRKTASQHRVKAAEIEVSISKETAKGVVKTAAVEVATTAVAIAKLDYTAFEKDCEADYYDSEASNASAVASAISAASSSRISAVMEAAAAEMSAAEQISASRSDAKTESSRVLKEAEKRYHSDRGALMATEHEGVAKAQSDADMTVGLVHTIGAESNGSNTNPNKK